jgi:hypothetical protein
MRLHEATCSAADNTNAKGQKIETGTPLELIVARDPEEIFDAPHTAYRADLRRRLPSIIKWLEPFRARAEVVPIPRRR